MERTVPTTESEEVELYQRTYYSLLRSTTDVRLRTLEEVHSGMNSLLHPAARRPEPDMPAFIYSILRLPACMPDVQLVVMGQNADVFDQAGFGNLRSWEEVFASARRRRCFYNGKGVMACYISSRSDIDDMIPTMTAYQIEWNKLHHRLSRLFSGIAADHLLSAPQLAEALEVPTEDIDRLYAVWDESFEANLERIASAPCDLRVRLLSGSLSEYRRARNAWWENIEKAVPEILDRPVYFVSSNTHSLVNILSGFALQHADQLVSLLEGPGNTGLVNEWKDIQAGRAPSSRENFLYYVLRKHQGEKNGRHLLQEQHAEERALGIQRIPTESSFHSRHSFDVEAQVIELAKLEPGRIDPRLPVADLVGFLESERADAGLQADAGDGAGLRSDALILNIDYPLGLAAYDILAEVSSHAGPFLGVYVMGKAASLNAVMGDVVISNVVHDEHSQNTYLFSNCFGAADVAPNLVYGAVLDNQKAVTVQGTFLQNTRYMDVFYREGYTVIEMETGPYLSAVYEMYRPNRHPVNEIVNLYELPFDLGFIHYVSDTPMSKGRNLGAGSLSYFGMDSTYAAALAVLRRIFAQEARRLQNQRRPRG